MARKTKTAVHSADDTALPAASETRLIALDQIYIHPFNPRKEPPELEIAALADSIRRSGLMQNLSGFQDQKVRFRDDCQDHNHEHIGIVAGGRRFRALQLLAATGEWSGPVPVRITSEPDTAKLWAGTENETVAGLPASDRITAYAQMRETGATVEAIATAFAKPISDVRRLLALASLPAAVLDALRDGKISIETAKVLTTASTAEDLDAALSSAIAKDKPGWQIRDMLRKADMRGNDKRAVYVTHAAYHEAGGRSTVDLFTDNTWLHDAELVKQLAADKLAIEAEEIRAAEGWAWVVVAEDIHQASQDLKRVWGTQIELSEGDQARHTELEELEAPTEAEQQELAALDLRISERVWSDEERATCGIIASIGHDGRMTTAVYLRKSDELNPDGTEIIPSAPEKAMPQNLIDDLRRIRLIAIQDTLRRDEAMIQDLLAMQMTGRLTPWLKPFALDQSHAVPPSKMDGMTIPAALAQPKVEDTGEEPQDLLAEWQTQSSETTNRLLSQGLARAFCRIDGPFVEALHARKPISPRALWTPTAAGFFNRVSAGYLDALWRELVPDQGSRHDGFAALPKKEKAKELERLFSDWSTREAMDLSRDINTRIDAWLPEELRFCAPQTAEADIQTEAAA